MINSQRSTDFKTKQAEFTAYIRNPETAPCPSDVRPERMRMYRELCFNNVESFLSSNFPVLRKILSDVQWQQLAQDFFADHSSVSPYFAEIPEEFIAYLQNERTARSGDYPFMLELAHYEWVEMALSVAQETLPEKIRAITDPKQKISLSPLAWLLAYQFPVHKISPDHLIIEPPKQPSYLIVYRDTEDEVRFIELAEMSFYLLQTIQAQQPMTIEACLTEIFPVGENHVLKQAALEALQQFVSKQIVCVAPE